MQSYEVMYIMKTRNEERKDEVVSKFENTIKENGGNVEKSDIWGTKRLAYTIQDEEFGIYVLTTFEAEAMAVKELDRKLRQDEEIMRHMIIRKGA